MNFSTSSTNDPASLPFEAAFQRLEAILKNLETGSIPLEEALQLYEEADKLVLYCLQKLGDAEKKIEILIKERDGKLALKNGEPIRENFDPTRS